MRQDELSGPDLAGVVADATAVQLDYVVIGGFGGKRLRDDKVLSIEDVGAAESIRVNSRHGIIDPIPGFDD